MLKLAGSISSARLYVIFLTFFLFSVTPALAQASFTTDETQFLALNPGLQFQDFHGTVVNSPLVFNPPENSQSNDDCFTPGQILPGIEFTVDPGGGVNVLVLLNGNFFGNGNPPNVLIANLPGDALDVIFTAPNINAVGLNVGCVDEGDQCTVGSSSVSVSVFGKNGFLGSTVIPVTSAFNSFIGINTLEPITEISLRHVNPDTDTVQGVLNVWYNIETLSVPTLSEWGMVATAAGLMLVGMFFVLKRKRSRMENVDSRFLGNDRKS